MLVRDVMNRSVVTAEPDITVTDAARIMADNKIGGIIIKKNQDVVGILTERDILLSIARGGKDFSDVRAGEIMTDYVIFVEADAQLEKAAKLMVENGIKKLPVLDGERLVGIITTSDIAAQAPSIIKDMKELISKKFSER